MTRDWWLSVLATVLGVLSWAAIGLVLRGPLSRVDARAAQFVEEHGR